jgi:hypothetical protein
MHSTLETHVAISAAVRSTWLPLAAVQLKKVAANILNKSSKLFQGPTES